MFRFDKYVNIVHHVEKVLCNIAVTPFVGVWIEMFKWNNVPSTIDVTPFVGVWIEIMDMILMLSWQGSHSLRGSVD